MIYYTIGEASVLHWRMKLFSLVPLGSNRRKSRKLSCPARLRMIAWVLGANGWRELITCAVAMPAAPLPIARLPGTEAEISVMRVGGGYERPNAGLPIPDDH